MTANHPPGFRRVDPAEFAGMKFEKPPGWNWTIVYEGEDGAECMSVFGCITIEDALKEARYSLDVSWDGEPADPVAILSVTRD